MYSTCNHSGINLHLKAHPLAPSFIAECSVAATAFWGQSKLIIHDTIEPSTAAAAAAAVVVVVGGGVGVVVVAMVMMVIVIVLVVSVCPCTAWF